MKDRIFCLLIVVAGVFATLSGDISALAAEADAEQWTRFEDAFSSSKDYDNPMQDVEVRVEFTSPSGGKRTMLGFWDGAEKWRVRFSPDEQGKWRLVAAPQVAMSFERDGDGKVIVMKSYQGGFDFELLREGYTPAAETDLKQAARYIGKYRSELRGVDFEVRIQNNRLAVDIPGQATFELHPPDEDGKLSFRAMPVISVAFHESQSGRVASMTLYKPGQEEKLPRLGASP